VCIRQPSVCEKQFQPGFTADFGYRFVTSLRTIVDWSRVKPGEWLALHGCGGVGLSAITIATAMRANVVAIDFPSSEQA
jgi:D-arabinose 1-dehydrogenase-like Zn-dependent alcohol dehydrogenase